MTQQQKRDQDNEGQEQGKLQIQIGAGVLRILGEPAGLYQMQVRHLWGNRYRVNVLVGVDAASSKVAHSYFVAADGAGHIVASTPTIAKRY